MRRNFIRLLIAILFVSILMTGKHLRAQESNGIRQVIMDQQSAWNRGEIVDFMRGYDNSPQTTFVGKTIEHGYAMILQRYRRNFASRDAMGHLNFSELQLRMLGNDHAVVTGRFHLARSQSAGGDASGVFSLVFEKKASGWKIILDHTSS